MHMGVNTTMNTINRMMVSSVMKVWHDVIMLQISRLFLQVVHEYEHTRCFGMESFFQEKLANHPISSYFLLKHFPHVMAKEPQWTSFVIAGAINHVSLNSAMSYQVMMYCWIKPRDIISTLVKVWALGSWHVIKLYGYRYILLTFLSTGTGTDI